MTKTTAFEKRIKRHIIGRTREYFIGVPLGWESVCKDELNQLSVSNKEIHLLDGGIQFKGNLIDCYTANLHLRTANRILMRIDCFKASNFGSLEKHILEIPWELYLFAGSETVIHVTVRRSRLYHSNAVADRVKACIHNRLQSAGIVSENTIPGRHHVFVRSEDDHFTISLDTSGELLFKRGIKELSATAPIRETLAAGILLMAGYKSQEVLIDPMCGSATFSLEAALIGTRTPPGWFREFSFMNLPSFQPKKWAYIRKEVEKGFFFPEKPFIFASDRDNRYVEQLKKSIEKCGINNAISYFCRDFFDFSPSDITDQKGLVVMNPPYGLRLGKQHEIGKILKTICLHLKREYIGWKFALIVPDRNLLAIIPFPFQSHPFVHGGKKRFLVYGKL